MDRAIVKAVRTLGYDQPTDMMIRKMLGLYVHFQRWKVCLCSTPNGKSVL